MIIFKGNVKLKDGTNLDVVPGGRRFSPNLQFASPELGTTRWGLTVMEPESGFPAAWKGFADFACSAYGNLNLLPSILLSALSLRFRKDPLFSARV